MTRGGGSTAYTKLDSTRLFCFMIVLSLLLDFKFLERWLHILPFFKNLSLSSCLSGLENITDLPHWLLRKDLVPPGTNISTCWPFSPCRPQAPWGSRSGLPWSCLPQARRTDNHRFPLHPDPRDTVGASLQAHFPQIYFPNIYWKHGIMGLDKPGFEYILWSWVRKTYLKVFYDN